MMSQTGFSTGLIVLAVGASLLATAAQAQEAGTTYRLGWLEVCGPGPQQDRQGARAHVPPSLLARADEVIE